MRAEVRIQNGRRQRDKWEFRCLGAILMIKNKLKMQDDVDVLAKLDLMLNNQTKLEGKIDNLRTRMCYFQIIE